MKDVILWTYLLWWFSF